MDKNLNVRRGLNRFSLAKRHFKQSVNQKLLSDNGVGRDFVPSEKSKKLRRLSIVGKDNLSDQEHCEMGCDVSDRDDKLPPESPLMSSVTSHRLKLSKKCFIDKNGVDYALVPRKLRSAIKKRNRESISPPLPESKKLNNSSTGVKSSKKNGIKKLKPNTKLEGSSWSRKQNVSGSITKDEEEAVETLYALAGMFPRKDEAHMSKLEDESLEANISALPGERGSDEPVYGGLSGSVVAKDGLTSFGQTTEAVNTPFNVEASRQETILFDTKKKSSVQEQHNVPIGQFSTGFESSVPNVDLHSINLLSDTKPITEKIMGTTFDFGVLSGPSLDTRWKQQPKQQETSLLGRKPELSQNPMSKVTADRMSRKRCAIHVYITHIIQVSQMQEREDRLPVQPNQLKQNERPEQGVVTNSFNGVRNGVMSAGGLQSSSAETKLNEANTTHQYKMLYQDQQHTALASGFYASQKQSFDFLSLLARGGGAEANVDIDRSREGLESFSQFHVPGLHSLPQHQTRVPFPIPETRYPSSVDPGHISAAAHQVQRQLPTYQNSTFIAPPDPTPTALATQQRQMQQTLWASQLEPQSRPVSTTMPQFPNWQNGRPFDASSSRELLRSKYSSISQHQQQVMANTSPNHPARLMRQTHHLPSAYDETGGKQPLQLLCNNRL